MLTSQRLTFLCLSRRCVLTTPTTLAGNSLPAASTQVRFATKKAGGSSSNGRDSIGRRLGIKVWPGKFCTAGSILIRQRGKKFQIGENTGMGRDHTIFAKEAGVVHYTRNPLNKKRNLVHIAPVDVQALMEEQA